HHLRDRHGLYGLFLSLLLIIYPLGLEQGSIHQGVCSNRATCVRSCGKNDTRRRTVRDRVRCSCCHCRIRYSRGLHCSCCLQTFLLLVLYPFHSHIHGRCLLPQRHPHSPTHGDGNPLEGSLASRLRARGGAGHD
ncbi:unnamed protein product, partial [Closterium sp. NIES-54]